ncbi:MAG: hypothetical protein HY592_04965 [Candidatus Omnitrophica bacterium]|nr:hypothetical protein [Candidatus Omnitrophota bacterium]
MGFPSGETLERLKGQPVTWIHAVSVGEVTQALQFARVLPGACVLTATTPAGFEVAQRLKRSGDVALYFPLDFRFSVRSFILKVRPARLVVLETEIWPNLFFECANKSVPIVLINGRISDKAFSRYRLIRPFLKPVLRAVSRIGVQSEAMRGRFLALGADPARVRVTGNIKWDWQPPQKNEDWSDGFKKTIQSGGWTLFMAGSTHEGEERVLLETFVALKGRQPLLKLFLAPRHLERLEAVVTQVQQKGLRVKVARDSGDLSVDDAQPDVWVLGKMGVLSGLYASARIVFVGGSLVPIGGHNPVEPAFFAKPVLFGPNMRNFREMADEFKRCGAALEVTQDNLGSTIEALLTRTGEAEAMGLKAKDCVSRHSGALRKSIELLRETGAGRL